MNELVHQIVRSKKDVKTTITGACKEPSCAWIPKSADACEQHTRETGHIVVKKEYVTTTTTYRLADGHAPIGVINE
jgi:hypothetical protein